MGGRCAARAARETTTEEPTLGGDFVPRFDPGNPLNGRGEESQVGIQSKSPLGESHKTVRDQWRGIVERKGNEREGDLARSYEIGKGLVRRKRGGKKVLKWEKKKKVYTGGQTCPEEAVGGRVEKGTKDL